jgi:predicted porin
MQKKIIALAVAGLVSGAAFAQSNVTVYGVADMGYVYAMDYAGSSQAAKDTKDISKMYSGGQSGSRLGFKGTEDLGNGLAANFRLESGINMDNGSAAQNGGTFSRWATVGLSGKNWGEVQFGRRDTLSDELIGGFDVTGRNTVAQASPIMKDVGRWDNMVAYISPNWSGFVLKAAFSTNATDGQASAPTGANYKSEVDAAPVSGVDANNLAKTNVYAYGISGTYVNGAIKLGAQYDKYDPQNVTGSNFNTSEQWTVVGSYDFGFANIGVEYGEINYGQNTYVSTGAGSAGFTSANQDSRQQYTIGAMIPVGAKARIAVQYAHGTDSFITAGMGDQTNSMWGVAGFYDLSKRTNLYAGYGNISQSESNAVLVGLDGQSKYQSAVQVGLRHVF